MNLALDTMGPTIDQTQRLLEAIANTNDPDHRQELIEVNLPAAISLLDLLDTQRSAAMKAA